MGAERSRRWKLLPFWSRSLPPPPPAASKPKHRPPDDVPVPPSPARKEEEAEEEVPEEFLCPILRAPMADPVILPSGRTYERACVRACEELGLSLGPDGVAAGDGNTPGGGAGGGSAVAIPNDALRAAVRTWCARSGRPSPVVPSGEKAREAVLRAAPAAREPERAASNLSCPSEAALAPARSASNLSCSSEGASAASTSTSSSGRVPIVRAGAVPALVDAVANAAAPPEACEHAAGALFGLALHEGNRAAIGVLGAVPPLLAVLADRDHAPRARRDAGMALYHLSLAAVNQSKLARSPGAARSLLSVASDGAEPAPIRRLALMVVCNVAASAEGRAALMDAGAVATASAILSDDGSRSTELQEWCVAALYAMSRGSPRFRGLARAAGTDHPLMLIAEQASPGVHKDMAKTALRTMLGLADNNSDDDQISECRNNEGSHDAPQRRRVASWSALPAATPPSSHQWRSVCID
ncbi:hypothetical protein BAE44_0022085 [Dichanthelium oligosanthes]|uniref:RING-type E3 ubiquitin transferase n=1 Tax=Dichanthelium oligosanthes TaxID=888268 RepID=A0A1E5UVI3_9POAL|nr:hypothetical protein BAE44_0022085 [Dichanthelium oligosanthes]